VTATLLTLLVLPAIYPWFRGRRTAVQQPRLAALNAAE
jgi:Cu/Ag efflux pump CusA